MIESLLVTTLLLAEPSTQPEEPPPDRSRESAMLSEVTQLTFGQQFARAGEAYFSPDGQRIIFQAVPVGQEHYQMYVADLDRSADGSIAGCRDIIQISSEPSRNTCGWFSPDGRTILFSSTFGKEKPDEPTAGYQREGRDYRWAYPSGMELWLIHQDEPAGEKITRKSLLLARREVLTDDTFYDAEGSISPDGKSIIFTSNRTGDLELFAMKSDGSGRTQLTHTPGYDGGPFFSPDGKRVLYRSDRKSNNLLQVFVSDLVFDDSGNITGIANEQQLTDDGHVNWGPFWHPSGEWIAWSTSAHGHHNYEVYLMRDDGSLRTRVTYSAGADVLPAFSPDGKYLIWSSKRAPDNTTQVFVAKFMLPD